MTEMSTDECLLIHHSPFSTSISFLAVPRIRKLLWLQETEGDLQQCQSVLLY